MRRVQAAGGATLSPADADPDATPAGEGAAAEGVAGKGVAPARPRRVAVLIGVAVFVIAADVISKALVVSRLAGKPPVHVLGNFLELVLTRNPGAAFNVGTSMTIVFTAIAVGVVLYILRAARNLRSVGWSIALGLLLGGATGNLIDRIFRAPGLFVGHVVDWIQVPHWPVFNLADSSVVCGGILVALLALRGIGFDGTRAAGHEHTASTGQ